MSIYSTQEIYALKGIREPLPSIVPGSESNWLEIFDPDGRKTEEVRNKRWPKKEFTPSWKNNIKKKRPAPVINPIRTVPDFFSSSTESETKFPCKGTFGGSGTFGCPEEDRLSNSFNSEGDSFGDFATPPGSPIRTRTPTPPAPIMNMGSSRSSMEEEKEPTSPAMTSSSFIVKRISRSTDSEMPSTSTCQEEKRRDRFSAPKKTLPMENREEEKIPDEFPGEPMDSKEDDKKEKNRAPKIPEDPEIRPKPKMEPVTVRKLQFAPLPMVVPIPLIWAPPPLPLLPPGLTMPPPPLPLMMPPGLFSLPPPGLPQPQPQPQHQSTSLFSPEVIEEIVNSAPPGFEPLKEDPLDKKKEELKNELKKKILEATEKSEADIEGKPLDRRRNSQADSSYATDESGKFSPIFKDQMEEKEETKTRHSSGRSSTGLPVVKMAFNPAAKPFVPSTVNIVNDEEKLPEMVSKLNIQYNVNAPEFKPSGSRNEEKPPTPPVSNLGAPPAYEDHRKYSRSSPSIVSTRSRHLELIDSEEEDEDSIEERPPPFIRTANGGIIQNPAYSRAPSRMSRVAPSERSAAPSHRPSWKPVEPVFPPDFNIEGNPQPVGYSVFDKRNRLGCAPDPSWQGSRANSRSQTSSRGPPSESSGPLLPMRLLKKRV